MTGNVGRPGAALLPLRGQNNVQGSSDMGALPDTYTAYRPGGDEDVARSFERAWGVELSRERGLTIPRMFDAAVAGDLKAMYIFGEDVAQTDPNTAHVVAALERLEFLVCQDIFETETTKYADVILPASSFLEKDGTFTNAERRVQLVAAAIAPPGGRAHFAALPYKTPGDAADEEFPLILVTGRRLQHYNAGTMTRRTGNVELNDRDYLEIHPEDAERLWINDGDMISIRSRQGRTEIMAQVTDRIERGHVFTTFHSPETRTNLLIGGSADVNTSCPEYKVIAVDVRPIGEEATMTPVLASA
jgi:predicted molibdopterin-dependent oxidoreductase YjgC